MKKKNLRAFTLAEVLITLTIIGVVSALTIPTLVQKTNKQEYVSALQKTYSVLSQATQRIIAEEGSPKADENGETWFKDNESFYNMYKKYLNNVKECGSETGCYTQSSFKCLGNNNNCYSGMINNPSSVRNLILADGTQISFLYETNACTSHDDGGAYHCGEFHIDVNGSAKPNRWGRDVFQFNLQENGVVPTGCEDAGSCTTANGSGYACACKVLTEGKMDY